MTEPRPPFSESLRVWAMLLGLLAVIGLILFAIWEIKSHRAAAVPAAAAAKR